tara:strand:+ start:69 stop:482 length:414 start_codon:yes stop_codon:yes gene_type:complete
MPPIPSRSTKKSRRRHDFIVGDIVQIKDKKAVPQLAGIDIQRGKVVEVSDSLSLTVEFDIKLPRAKRVSQGSSTETYGYKVTIRAEKLELASSPSSTTSTIDEVQPASVQVSATPTPSTQGATDGSRRCLGGKQWLA